MLCFIEADWPLIGGAFATRDVDVLWPRRLYPRLQDPGPLSADHVAAVHRRLANALVSAG